MSRLKNTGSLRKVTPQVVPHTEGLSEKFLEKRPAVSYFMVSTKGKADDEKSGLDRQDEAHRCAFTDVLMCNFIGPLELFSSSSAMVWTALKDGLGAEELFHQHQAGQFMGKGHRRQAQLPVGLSLDLLG